MREAQLLPDNIKDKLPRFYAQDHNKDPTVYMKFFCSTNHWTWFVIEGEEETACFKFFGYVIGYVKAWGYFSLDELLSVECPEGACIERDESFSPKPVSQIPEITTLDPSANSILYSFERL